MKKKPLFFPYKTILILVLFFFVGTTSAFYAVESPPPPPPPGNPPVATVGIDFYIIPMIITAIVFAFFYIKKNN